MSSNLKNTTFIIPLRIEHPDRYRNAKTVLGFLNHHLETNVFIYEISESGQTKLDFLGELTNLKIKHWVRDPEKLPKNPDLEIFYRTKYLNIMLDEVQTPVVVNYDIDVLIRPEFYEECQNMILDKEADVIYPFKFGPKGQIRVLEGFDYESFITGGYDLDYVVRYGPMNYYDAEYGHCIFFNSETYKKLGGENENFISYGPEDKERGVRFSRLGYNVKWITKSIVHHFEHYRGQDSGSNNPYFSHNWEVFRNLERMENSDLGNYYKNTEYSSNYKTICKN